MVDYVYRDGQRLTPWMAYQIDRLSTDMHAHFGVWVKVRSAIRTYEEQKQIFLDRYVTAGNVNGRRVYDTRWWNGQLWYRISSAGTVAVPGSSNHEIQGSKAAVDLYDTGADGGIATMGSARSNWLRANASRYGLVASGFGFGEAWHYDVLNIWNTPPSTPSGGTAPIPLKKGKIMHFLYCADNVGPLWTLVNAATGELVQTRNQDIANTWADAWGNAEVCGLQAFLNALHAVKLTTDPATRRTESLQKAIDEIAAAIAAK